MPPNSTGQKNGRASTHPNSPEADFRDYGIGAQILRDVGVRKMIILSDAAPRLANLPGYGLEIVDTVPLSINEQPPPPQYRRSQTRLEASTF